MAVSPDGHQVQRIRRRRRKDANMPDQDSRVPENTSTSNDEEVSTFLQLEEEAERLAHMRRECPVPKPGGRLGEFLGFKHRGEEQQTSGRAEFPRSDVNGGR